MNQEHHVCACGCGLQPKESNRYIHGHNAAHIKRSNYPKGKDSPAWKGGAHQNDDGYHMIRVMDNARTNANKYMREHLLIAERALGRPLDRTMQVHHVNEDKSDNSPGNLVICQDQEYHRLLHRRRDALLATGDPTTLRCCLCRGYGGSDMSVTMVGKYQRSYHRHCHAAKQYALKMRKRLAEAV